MCSQFYYFYLPATIKIVFATDAWLTPRKSGYRTTGFGPESTSPVSVDQDFGQNGRLASKPICFGEIDEMLRLVLMNPTSYAFLVLEQSNRVEPELSDRAHSL